MTSYPMKCHISNEGGGATRVDVYDDIGGDSFWSDGISAKSFSAQLAKVKGPLDVHINSAGGDVADGLAISNTIRRYKGFKRTINDGFAASIASIIFLAGDERVAEPGSMAFVHDPLTLCYGNAAEMAKTAETLDKHGGNLAQIYADRAGGTADEWREVMQAETWYTAEEQVEHGLADKIGDGEAELPAGLDLAAFVAVPGRIAARLRTMPQAAAGTHAPFSGTHSHAHAANGSQGGDATHSHEHSHDDDADHGHSHADAEPEPDGDEPQDVLTADAVRALIREELRAALAAASGVDNSPWDASKAWHNGAESDDPAAFYGGICAGKKDGDKATQAAWALPYKYHPGDPPNADGVKAALSRLPQTQGLTNEAEAKATLQAAMKKVNPDYEPDDRAHAHLDFSRVDLGQLGNSLKGAIK